MAIREGAFSQIIPRRFIVAARSVCRSLEAVGPFTGG
jgi:hypothetical protein